MATDSQVWFITGASSGFGRHMTELVLKKGHKAAATLRKPEVVADLAAQYGSDRVLVLKLDVSSAHEIKEAFGAAVDHFGRIDVVFSNAGHKVEHAPEDMAREMFETNFWGSVNVAKETLRVFRDVNKTAGGHLLQVSSSSAIQGFPAFGFYSATKHGVIEALAGELDPGWNVKITLIEPGAFRTGAVSTNLPSVPLQGPYAKPNSMPAVVRSIINEENFKQLPHPTHAVAAMYKLTTIPDPPLHLPLGQQGIDIVKRKLTSMLAETDKFASWSDGMGVDEVQF
ncbi:uncharacterized protein C8Q71DRAFT_902921 [Rhodofomes roseus]|uniref:NAD(P)-binding protein n=1 Tax=Rhodofomes roseus TaxID=34475 RepID=A0ABQ8KX27_9APHY|nr:uncharacterized protein C8Q71DRAFT_902921 [Rhodofomes roseus]KAH9843766.1 hypothetical protein C8Q71DRAFT_902921 [Rhodofomes roseus]